MIAIDVRGFGGSTHPADVQSSSTLADITGDLTCVLEHVGIQSAICLGYVLQKIWSDLPNIFILVMTGVLKSATRLRGDDLISSMPWLV